jgi:hypothetical protein
MTALTRTEFRRTTWALAAFAALWAATLVIAAQAGLISRLYMPVIALLVATTIALPTLIYAASARLKTYVDAIGLFPLTAFHIWRIPAALLFFWYGGQGELPPTFWILAGVGDFIAGALALTIFLKPPTRRQYILIHSFGFFDFVVAVGTGLTFTLLQDSRMALVTILPMALIPLLGVGISGTTHLIAFDYLRRHRSEAL